jgi:uncharacterized protein
MIASAEVLPSYFGSLDKALFGCLNEPRSGLVRSCAVVICQPIGHEYDNSHRALRQLAVRLAEKGFPVLRFDYFGCGDSSGDAEEGRISQWLEDVSQAVLEIKRRTSLWRFCLVGLRLGASLALMTATRRNDIQNLVLWDPVVKGRDYLDGLISLENEMLRFRPKHNGKKVPAWPKDIVGFPIGSDLYEDIGNIDLLAIPRKPADNILIVETERAPIQNDLKVALEQAGTPSSFKHVDARPVWLPAVNGSLLVPDPVLQAVTSWIGRICP